MPRDELVHADNTVVGVGVGFVDLELARDRAHSDAERVRIGAELRSVYPTTYPALARNIERLADRAFSLRWTSAAEPPLDDSFDFLMDLIIDGLRRRAGRGAR